MDRYDGNLLPAFTLAKGNYFSCQTPPAFSRLIYPVPVIGGLGVHVTLDLAGQMRFGPDVEWLGHADPDKIDYRVDAARSAAFYEAVRTYWPALPDGAIVPAYSGCRPKLSGPDGPGRRLPNRRAHPARTCRPRASLRYRIARPHQFAGYRGLRRQSDRRLTQDQIACRHLARRLSHLQLLEKADQFPGWIVVSASQQAREPRGAFARQYQT